MEDILKRWKKFLAQKRVMKEMMYLDDFLIPDRFIDGLPQQAKNRIRKFGVLDFAFERYRDVETLKDKQFNKMPSKFFAPYGGKQEQFFDFSTDDEHKIARQPTKEEIAQRGKNIPVLPSNWYEAFIYHYPDQTLNEKKKKTRDLSLVKTLAVFDFDETLFKSDKAAERLRTDHPLSPDSLPENPRNSDWNLDVVYKAQELCSNPQVYCVMMTGRVGDRFKEKIDNLLFDKRIFFAETHYNEFGGDTAKYKTEAIYSILDKLPNVQNLVMWEDQKEKADKYTEEFSNRINFNIHMVGEKDD